jgi:hypothetical protein
MDGSRRGKRKGVRARDTVSGCSGRPERSEFSTLLQESLSLEEIIPQPYALCILKLIRK